MRGATSWTIDGSETLSYNSLTRKTEWKIAGDEMRIESVSDNGATLFTTGEGRAAMRNSTGTQPVSRYVAHSMFVPALAAKYLQEAVDDPAYGVESLGTERGSGETMVRTASHASYSDIVVTSRTWFFDSRTGLPVKVEYRMPAPGNPAEYGVVAVALGNYQRVSGIEIPFSAEHSIGNSLFKAVSLTSVVLNQGVSQSDFAPLLGEKP